MEEDLIELINNLTPNQLERFEALINENKDEYIKRLTFNIGHRAKKDLPGTVLLPAEPVDSGNPSPFIVTTTNKIQRCPDILKYKNLPVKKYSTFQPCNNCGKRKSKAFISVNGTEWCLPCACNGLQGFLEIKLTLADFN